MSRASETTDRASDALAISRARSVCLLVSWSLEALAERPPEAEGRRAELLEGLSYAVELVAVDLGRLYERVVND